MANEKTKVLVIWQSSPRHCDWRKIRWPGNNACAASGNDWSARHKRRTLSARRPAGCTTSHWQLWRIGDYGNGATRLALAYHRRRKEDSRVPRATCHLRIDSVDPRASCAASETAAFKAAGRRSLRHGDGIRRGTLDE